MGYAQSEIMKLTIESLGGARARARMPTIRSCREPVVAPSHSESQPVIPKNYFLPTWIGEDEHDDEDDKSGGQRRSHETPPRGAKNPMNLKKLK